MKHLILLSFYLITFSILAQETEYQTFYIRATSENINLSFARDKDGTLRYNGENEKLSEIFSQATIVEFKKAFPSSRRSNLLKTYSVKTFQKGLMQELLREVPEVFEFGEYYIEPELLYTPNDYGGGGGLSFDHSNLDFIGAKEAWDYTTGSSSVNVGISDAIVDSTDTDFSNKITMIPPYRTDTYTHGNSVSGIAVANGDNNYGTVGVCYDCSITHARTGYNAILDLSYAGAKVINCSWGSYSYSQSNQEAIYEAYDNGTIIVASSGNRSWAETQGNDYNYPASYDKVISVTSVGHKHDSPYEDIQINEDGTYYMFNVKNYIGRSISYENNDPTNPNHFAWTGVTNTLNDSVDIAAPGMDIFSYGPYIINDTISYAANATSPAAPHVTGTIGLMLDLNPCLTFEEVESVLKLSSNNIDDIEANQPFYENYGSGSLNTYKAVKMVYDMITSGETVLVENQDFYRWDFILKSAPEKIKIQNQTFRDKSNVTFKAKESIELGEGTNLLPDNDGDVELIIDSSLTPCNVVPKPAGNKLSDKNNVNYDENKSLVKIYPNPNDGRFKIQYDSYQQGNNYSIIIYDVYGKKLYQGSLSNKAQEIDVSHFSSGIYLLRVISKHNTEIVKFVKK